MAEVTTNEVGQPVTKIPTGAGAQGTPVTTVGFTGTAFIGDSGGSQCDSLMAVENGVITYVGFPT